MQPSVKINATEFNRTLAEYKRMARKEFATILNVKAFYIARGASRLTPRADYRKFADQLGLKLGNDRRQSRLGRPTMNP